MIERLKTFILIKIYNFLFSENIILVKLDMWLDRMKYYRHRTNLHKHPTVTRLFCYLDRHDYETAEVHPDHAILKCFYCNKKKKSFLPHSPVTSKIE